MKILDTFAGIGGFHLAFTSASKTCNVVAAVEVDKDAQNTYRDNFPDTYIHGDITKLDIESLPDFDILTGGFPCQPFSRNGKSYNHASRGKFVDDDARSNLFLNLVNILQVKKPKAFLFENVKGLLTIKNRDGSSCFDTIVGLFEECGYTVKTKVMSPHNYGFPQQRNRVFFVGVRKDLDVCEFVFPESFKSSVSVKDILEPCKESKYLLTYLWKNRKVGEASGSRLHTHPRLECLENNMLKDAPTSPTGEITPLSIIYGDTPSGLPRQQDKLYSVEGVSPTIATFAHPAFATEDGWRVLTPREIARLQGFPDTFKLHKNDGKAWKQLGNAVHVGLVTLLCKNLLKVLS